MPKRDDGTEKFNPFQLQGSWTEDEDFYRGCDPFENVDQCWQCRGDATKNLSYDYNTAPDNHMQAHFCSKTCERTWHQLQPLNNLLFKRAFKRANTGSK